MKIPVHEGCCMYDGLLCYRVCRVRKLAQKIGAVPTVHLKRARDPAQLRTRHPALSTAWDQQPIGIPIGATPDCRPQPGRTSPDLAWSRIAENTPTYPFTIHIMKVLRRSPMRIHDVLVHSSLLSAFMKKMAWL
jgi:hypothetical protein